MAEQVFLVDCDCIVKELRGYSRRPNIRLAVPQEISFKNFEAGESIDSLTVPKDIQFDFSFHEDGADVYTRNTKIIPYFRWRQWNGQTGNAVKLDINAKEIVETVLQKRIKWMMGLFEGRDVSVDKINVAVEVMAKEIVSEICI